MKSKTYLKKDWRKLFAVPLVGAASLWMSMASPASAGGPIMDWLFGTRTPAVPVGPPQYLPSPNAVAPVNGYSQSAFMPSVSGIPQTQMAYLPTAGYSSQWNRAPVTYYRPVTQLDPTTGTTVTRMMPCTSYELQAQRVPMVTLHPTYGSNVAVNRWPSMAASHPGSTPVPSNYPQSNYPLTTMTMLPNTGAVLTPGVSTASSWPTTYSNPVVTANAMVPAPTWTGNSIPTNAMPVYPNTSSYSLGVYPTPSVSSPGYSMGTGSLTTPGLSAPLNSSPYNGSVMPGTTYTAPPTSGWQVVPGTGSLEGNGSLFQAPAAVQPNAETSPSNTKSGVADEESTVKPSLDRSRDGASNEPPKSPFQLRNVAREPLSLNKESAQATAPAMAPEAPKESREFDGLRPIPAPADLQEPQFNPGLLDPRDRTASLEKRSIQPIVQPIRYSGKK